MANLFNQPVKQRLQSIDILRGIVMLIMVLDHSRHFFHNAPPFSDPTNMAHTTPLLFFTRWITHFCAPNFVFLTGLSAYLAGTRRTKSELSAFLIKRGLWLVLIEVVVLSFAFSLNPFYNFITLQVLWLIGWSMVILGLLVKVPLKVIAVIGAVIFFSHDLFDYLKMPEHGIPARLVHELFTGGTGRLSVIPLNKTHVIFNMYALLPWTSIMLLGYAFGSIFEKAYNPQKRKKILLYSGISLLTFFVILRYLNIYGDPSPWAVQPNGIYTFMSFLNVSKPQPSLLFSCLTIGTGLIVLALAENIKTRVSDILIVYGNVPFFYYVLHFYVLRAINVIVFFAQGYGVRQINAPNHSFWFSPPGFGFNLAGVYLIWLFVIVLLYFPCYWYSNYKKTHKQWWLSYI